MLDIDEVVLFEGNQIFFFAIFFFFFFFFANFFSLSYNITNILFMPIFIPIFRDCKSLLNNSFFTLTQLNYKKKNFAQKKSFFL